MGAVYKIRYSKILDKRVQDIVDEYNNKTPKLPPKVELIHYFITNDGKN